MRSSGLPNHPSYKGRKLDTYRGKMTSFPPLCSCNLHWIGAILISDQKKKHHVHIMFIIIFLIFPISTIAFPWFSNLPRHGPCFSGPAWPLDRAQANLRSPQRKPSNEYDKYVCMHKMDGRMDGWMCLYYIYIYNYIQI